VQCLACLNDLSFRSGDNTLRQVLSGARTKKMPTLSTAFSPTHMTRPALPIVYTPGRSGDSALSGLDFRSPSGLAIYLTHQARDHFLDHHPAASRPGGPDRSDSWFTDPRAFLAWAIPRHWWRLRSARFQVGFVYTLCALDLLAACFGCVALRCGHRQPAALRDESLTLGVRQLPRLSGVGAYRRDRFVAPFKPPFQSPCCIGEDRSASNARRNLDPLPSQAAQASTDDIQAPAALATAVVDWAASRLEPGMAD